MTKYLCEDEKLANCFSQVSDCSSGAKAENFKCKIKVENLVTLSP